MSNLVEIKTQPISFGNDDGDDNKKKKGIIFCHATWHEACPPMEAILNALWGTAGQEIFFGKLDAESVSDVAEMYNVTMVPTILLLNGGSNPSNIVERLEGGVDPAQITQAVQRLMVASVVEAEGEEESGNDGAAAAAVVTTTADPEAQLNERLKTLISSDEVVLFMKGKPTEPKCGFSRQAVELLNSQEVSFGSFDILQDEEVRQGLKKYSNWPTYPQFYVNGELMGGLDVIKEMMEDGPLKEQWNLTAKSSGSNSGEATSLNDRLKQLINRHKVMIFMKGLPSAPQCGFSRQLIELMDESNVSYDAFNILQDEEVRQGLKKYSNWPTYPQLYVDGDLVGGLDIIKELKESDELDDLLKQ